MNQMQVNRLELSENKQKISDNFVNSIVDELYAINFYPDTDYVRVKELIAHYNCVSANNIFVGNGSDEIILSIMLGLGIVNTSIAVPRNSFMGYYFSGVLLNNEIAFMDLTNYSIDRDYAHIIDRLPKAGVSIFCMKYAETVKIRLYYFEGVKNTI